MPRKTPNRTVGANENLARRIEMERKSRGWSIEGLANRMTAAGCPMNGSAIYRIEDPEIRRKVDADELVTMATLFEMSVADLLTPPEAAHDSEVRKLFRRWQKLDGQHRRLRAEAGAAWDDMVAFADASGNQALGTLRELLHDNEKAYRPHDPSIVDTLLEVSLVRDLPTQSHAERERERRRNGED
ncbi:helix-turn-helix domain-containing protein [Nocardioides nitrophenolicus]|uniref:helix-turn-helix domain-containing protein n=1 Tax=Nocardioides nitrophenolicus TaxID=60489 RepID=UPI000AC28981|nr:helix-turn-helix transcriptional regulator [Nocardioides nitrophenolicus]MBM7519177.1 transcriptional regulator with XRE-family HTH domain [Nocardioides nitrophenolicus]